MSFLTLENAVKNYQLGETTVNALRGVSLSIEKGEYSVIWGLSGCGKSTLLNILATTDRVTSGKYMFADNNIAALNDRTVTQLREQKIGIIFQTFNLVPVLTAVENVMLPAQLSRNSNRKNLKERALDILETVDVIDYAHHLPDQLSGGQRQRVALARSLINEPELVIADEPTANLDTKNSRNIIELFSKMNKTLNTTFVLSSHDPRLIESATRKIHLQDGEILTDEIISSQPVITEPSFINQAIAKEPADAF